MSNSVIENQQRAMSRIISNIASIQSLFPVLWDPIDNAPQATWADRLGLVDRPESAWDRIQQPPVALRVQELQGGADHWVKIANGQLCAFERNQVRSPDVEIRRVTLGVATIQSLFPDLWDHVDDGPEDVWRDRLEDARRPDSPWNRARQQQLQQQHQQQPYVPFAAQQRDFLGPIGRPQFADENDEDWSDSESESEDDWASDYEDDDSGFDSGSDVESVASMDQQQEPNAELDVIDDYPLYVDREYYCPSCDRMYIFRHFADDPMDDEID